jgi:tetratricopeptide (TPR) repeat protein
MSVARTQTAAAAAVVLAPSTPEPDTAPNPARALAWAPEPVTASTPPRVPAPLLALPSSAPPWLETLRRRRWPAAAAALAVLVTVGLVVAHRSTAPSVESSAPGPKAVPESAAALPSAAPPAPPAEVAPDARNRIAAADRPVAAKDAAPSTGRPSEATGHTKAGARAHAVQRTHRQKRRTARPSHGKHARSKQTRVVALERAAAPQAAGDESSARASYERGNQRLLTGDTAAAISAYEEAVRAAPSSPSGYRGLGLAYEKEGKIAEAVRAFRHYLKLAPSSGDRDLVAKRLRHLLRPGVDPSK